MKLRFEAITEQDVLDILTWTYEPPYHVYNMDQTLISDSDVAEAVAYFTNPAYAFHAMFDVNVGRLAAFCSYSVDGQVPGGNYEDEAIDIGMGVRPDLTGKGSGAFFAAAAIEQAIHLYQPEMLRVTIADFNSRAIRVWEKNGFVPVESFVHKVSQRGFTVFCRRI